MRAAVATLVCLAAVAVSVLARAPASQVSSQNRDRSSHQVRWVTIDSSVKLEVLDWGGSGPPLVLLACYVSTHVYDEFAPKLTDQFHVYGITRRGIGASDKPATGYSVQQSANDLFEVLNALKLQQALLVGHSCAGQVLTMFAAEHGDRLRGLIYLDGATDPTLDAEVGSPYPDFATLPRPISNGTKRSWDFPEAINQEQLNPVTRLDPVIRKAITVDARMKPDYTRVRVPVLAIYQAQPPFEEVAAGYTIRNDKERAALRQYYAATRALYARWQQDLLAGVPTARIVELPGANLYMFLSNEADVVREIRSFVNGL